MSISHLEWLDYLRQRGLVSLKVRQEIAHDLRDERPYMRMQAIIFLASTQQQHSDLWVAYRTKMRLLGRLK
jgi:hypothetical protein